MYLMSKGLWDAVLGGAGVTAMKEQQGHTAIVLNLKDSSWFTSLMQPLLTKPGQHWRGFYRTQDMASRIWLKEKFASFKYTAKDMSAHVMELEQLVLQMRSAYCEPNEEDVCATMLRSLSAAYESLVQVYRMNVTQFSFSNLVSKLIAEEVRKQESCRIESATRGQATRKAPVHQKEWRSAQKRSESSVLPLREARTLRARLLGEG
ncbi:copia protein (gagintpol protein) [Plasmopara halstedii]|uniref:Copia protein (Gagintpol protein) n=1 Tax=Plasmopara halstedii TaxID=4781 RepID=A0A0P1AC10_PLAHL|nr:copia protein (gagintpol protein) [Plasmopara halstedii]CEG37846.1 copia protein (gagintpol protein) [Plasmopara halstedii]|eukprot:XP_024574215.1 copia protein (gagintpol protein) [Plasmopara halstedii]